MSIYSFAITLILVMDPLGNIPIFLSILRRFEPQRQIRIILRESLIAFIILAIFLFFGRYIMHGLKISTSALSVAGGIILFIISIRMIFPKETPSTTREEEYEEPLIVPLAIPFTAGPSALATILLFATRYPTYHWMLFLGVVIASVIFTVIMLFSRYLMNLLGKRVLVAFERLMGMILTTIAVQMFLSGILDYIHGTNAV